jgi:hypothetical protein
LIAILLIANLLIVILLIANLLIANLLIVILLIVILLIVILLIAIMLFAILMNVVLQSIILPMVILKHAALQCQSSERHSFKCHPECVIFQGVILNNILRLCSVIRLNDVPLNVSAPFFFQVSNLINYHLSKRLF